MHHRSAPLPFRDQKRQWLNQYNQALALIQSDTIIDAFGGSGLLAHRAKRLHPAKRVIWNDFDGFRARLDQIERTAAIRADLRELLAEIPRLARVPDELRARGVQLLARHEEDGPLDWISLSGWILFSGDSAASIDELRTKLWWQRIPRADLVPAPDYLAGVERVQEDFESLLARHPDAAIIADPPYPTTDCTGYAAADAIDVNERLLKILVTEKHREFVYWSNSRSLGAHAVNLTREGCRWWARRNQSNYASRQTEYMVSWTRSEGQLSFFS